MPKPVRTSAASVVSALVFAACGSKVVDDQKLEDLIKDTPPTGVTVRSVDCPSDVDVDVGKTITCMVDVAGGSDRELIWRIDDEDANLALVGDTPVE